MTTENTIPPTPAATLTESELWSEFTKSGFPIHCTHTGRLLVYEMPHDLITDEGEYGTLDLVGRQFASDLQSAECPSGAIRELIDDLQLHVEKLELVRSAFASLCADRIIDADDGKEDAPAAYTGRTDGGAGPSTYWTNDEAA